MQEKDFGWKNEKMESRSQERETRKRLNHVRKDSTERKGGELPSVSRCRENRLKGKSHPDRMTSGVKSLSEGEE